MVTRIAFFVYGCLAYLLFLATFLYAIAFVGAFAVPTQLDGPATTDFRNDLQNSYNQLKSSIDSLSGSQTVAQALPSIQAAVQTFDANLNAIRTTTCNFTPTNTATP
jgi:hypothetical protein